MNYPLEVFELPWLNFLLNLGIALAVSVILGRILVGVTLRIAKYYDQKSPNYLFDSVRRHLRGPLRWFMPLLVLYIGWEAISPEQPEAIPIPIARVIWISVLLAFGRLLLRGLRVLQDIIEENYSLQEEDNLGARKVRTQTAYLRRILSVVIVLVIASVILLSFDRVKELGTGLLASAGLAGIVLGFAAQKSLANLLAGFQIAFTQPIRIDDVVVVEGEWGRIEEITLTYVVVRIWDKRRLVLPITYFIEKPFQNWTRVSADVIGTVFLNTDYGVPINALREELKRLLEGNALWDGEIQALQVVNSTDKIIELRALVGARTSSDAWDLRCHVREKLYDFISENYPKSLPQTRAILRDSPAQSPAFGQETKLSKSQAAETQQTTPGVESEAEREEKR